MLLGLFVIILSVSFIYLFKLSVNNEAGDGTICDNAEECDPLTGPMKCSGGAFLIT